MNLPVRESTRKVVYLNVVDPFADSASELPCKREQFVQLQKQSKNLKRKKRIVKFKSYADLICVLYYSFKTLNIIFVSIRSCRPLILQTILTIYKFKISKVYTISLQRFRG